MAKIQEINYLRSFAIISIVIWHGLVCPIGIWGLIENDSSITNIIRNIGFIIIPDANMPLFTAISGFLLAYLMEYKQTKYSNFLIFFKTKVKRLLIPYFILGTLVNITAPQRELSQIIYGEGSHLWFCAMLFWCFPIAWAGYTKKYFSYFMLFLSLIIILLFSNNWSIPKLPLGLHNTLYFYFYFQLGILIFQKRELLMGKLCRYTLIFTIMYLITTILAVNKIYIISLIALRLRSTFFILMLFSITTYLLKKNILKESVSINKLCEISFGIYVFHEWIFWDFYHIPIITELLNEYHVLFATLTTILVFYLSCLITKLLLRTKIGYFLLA